MLKVVKKITAAAAAAACALSLCACSAEGFYELFIDEEDTSTGVYYVIYNSDSTDEEIASIGEFPFMKADLYDEIKEYDLSLEITMAFDVETDSDATFTIWYYHNSDDEEASDYCATGFACLGTYTMADDVISFVFEPDGYNIAIYDAGEDYADLAEFKAFSYADDGSCGIWAYALATYEYEDEAVITDEVVENLPAVMNLTVSGNKITGWEFEY